MAIKYKSRIDKLAIWGGNAYVLPREKLILETMRDINLWKPKMKQCFDQIYGREWIELINKHIDHYHNLNDICKNEVQNIRCSTLVLHGNLDPLPEEHPKFLTHNIPDSRLHRFPRGPHNLHQEFHLEFNKVVTQFLLE